MLCLNKCLSTYNSGTYSQLDFSAADFWEVRSLSNEEATSPNSQHRKPASNVSEKTMLHLLHSVLFLVAPYTSTQQKCSYRSSTQFCSIVYIMQTFWNRKELTAKWISNRIHYDFKLIQKPVTYEENKLVRGYTCIYLVRT